MGCGPIEDNGTDFIYSYSYRYAGGLVFKACNKVTLADVTFVGSNGSAVVFTYTFSDDNTGFSQIPSYTISSCRFINNTMARYGGGVVVHLEIWLPQQIVFEDSNFTGNFASDGGGVYLQSNYLEDCFESPTTVLFNNCTM